MDDRDKLELLVDALGLGVHRRIYQRVRDLDAPNDEIGEGPAPHAREPHVPVTSVESKGGAPTPTDRHIAAMHHDPQPTEDGSKSLKKTEPEPAPQRRPTWLDNYMAGPHIQEDPAPFLTREMKRRREVE